MLVDTHCHLTYDEFAPALDAVLARACEAGVSRWITVGTTPADARRGLELARERPGLYVAAGIHPHEAARADVALLDELRELHRSNAALVAVGETGLDFHYDFAPPDVQERVFRAQLALALEVQRSVIIHARKAELRVCEILDEYPALRDRVVFHCFSGDAGLAERVLAGGWWLSFTGVVTFANADAVRSAALAAPLDRILVETDAPYLSPEPVRKQRPCEPAFTAHTARFLAKLRGVAYEEFAALTTDNARRFFGLSV